MRKRGPSWSISGRRKTSSKSMGPGPGTYSPLHVANSPKFSIGRSKRLSLKKFLTVSPGPGAYQTSRTASSSCIIGTSRRESCKSVTHPGPGDYKVFSPYPGPSYTICKKPLRRKSVSGPGPGEYTPLKQTIMVSVPKWCIGREKRMAHSIKDAPGPGDYKHDSKLTGPSWKFGKSTRLRRNLSAYPGPGAYNID